MESPESQHDPAILTLIISAPSVDPTLDTLFVSGNFDNWSGGSTQYQTEILNDGRHKVQILGSIGQTIFYKFTLGSWSTAEGLSNGAPRPNREYTFTSKSHQLHLTIEGWESQQVIFSPQIQQITAFTILICLSIAIIVLGILATKTPADMYLALFLFAQSPIYIPSIIHMPNELVFALLFTGVFAGGPAIYMWVVERIVPSSSIIQSIKKAAPHFILSMLVFLWLATDHEVQPYQWLWFRLSLKFHFIIYLCYSLHLLWKHQEILPRAYADDSLGRVLLPLIALGALLILASLELMVSLGWATPNIDVTPFLITIRGFSNVAFCLVIIATPCISVFSNSTESSQVPVAEIQRSTTDGAKALLSSLEEKMRRDRLYLNPSLTMQSLADATDVNVYVLSEAINKVDGSNFYQYVNRYRVEHAKQLLLDKQTPRPAMKSVCFDSGFNNRTTFNKAFKQIVGITPSEFLSQRHVIDN